MKVKDLIERLGKFDPEIKVTVADWSEQYSSPSESDAELMCLESGNLVIGCDDPAELERKESGTVGFNPCTSASTMLYSTWIPAEPRCE